MQNFALTLSDYFEMGNCGGKSSKLLQIGNLPLQQAMNTTSISPINKSQGLDIGRHIFGDWRTMRSAGKLSMLIGLVHKKP